MVTNFFVHHIDGCEGWPQILLKPFLATFSIHFLLLNVQFLILFTEALMGTDSNSSECLSKIHLLNIILQGTRFYIKLKLMASVTVKVTAILEISHSNTLTKNIENGFMYGRSVK